MPALLPMISTDLQLADSQGAALTVGYTVRWVPSQTSCNSLYILYIPTVMV